MDIKLQNHFCDDVPISKIESYFLAEYREGAKTIFFRLYDGKSIEWIVDDPEYVLNKIDLLIDFYYSNSINNMHQEYYNVENM